MILQPAVFECLRCAHEAPVRAGAGTPMHNCRAVSGMSLPLIPKGSGADVRLVEREDYIGQERGLVMVGGRPVMAVETRRNDGSNDLTVFPGVAVAHVNN